MSTFPRPPFVCDATDSDLVSYLKQTKINYLGSEAESKIKELELGRELSLQREPLRALWPMILTDALKCLKRNDTREWRPDSGIDFDSIFNKDSLGIDALERILVAFSKFETLMYGAQPTRYRDHIIHTFRVWIIGHGLLDSCFGGQLHVDDLPGSISSFAITGDEWQCIWAIAALCHDIGYPLSAIGHINQKTREALITQGLEEAGDLRYNFSVQAQLLHDTILRLMSSKLVAISSVDRTNLRACGGEAQEDEKGWLTHLQNKYYLKFLNSFDQRNHGVISALLLGKSLVYFLESDYCHDGRVPLNAEDAKQFLIRREILRAVAAHTCPEIYHLRFNTLSFLLYIVDELQRWGRPTFEMLRGIDENADEKVNIREFSERNIDILVSTKDASDSSKQNASNQINSIARRLRLALGSQLMKDLQLVFSVETNGSAPISLTLRDGKIAKRNP